jgi:hypothetical protein
MNGEKDETGRIKGFVPLKYSDYIMVCISYLSLCYILNQSHTHYFTLIVLDKESFYLVQLHPVTKVSLKFLLPPSARKHRIQLSMMKYAKKEEDRQYTYNNIDAFTLVLLPWKSNNCYLFVCACM